MLIGQTIGHYRIDAVLGEGGMGRVYRAHDVKLHRDVAIKVFLPSVAGDPDRLARFGREAHVLASLNHTNIAQIHGLEEGAAGTEHAGVRALVMELVEGEDLAARLARGALPADEALPIARQVAEALEAAHDHGVIHRDLKPANIKVRPDGTVKVLDFGLAKALEPADANPQRADAVANSPTLSMQATRAGVILGTAAYMSPEQARGRAVDRRTDIWAFGCVVFEMLAGRRAFPGDDITDIIVAVLSKEPDWQALPSSVSPTARRLLRRCLEKDPRRRLDSASAARLEIDEALSPTADYGSSAGAVTVVAPTTVAVSPRRRAPVGIALAAGLAGVALGAALLWPFARPGDAPPTGITRTLIDVAPAETLRSLALDQSVADARPSRHAFALSPDGRSLVFSATSGGHQQLFVRPLDQFKATPLPGTDEGHSPFFSPDGQWVAFQAGRALKKMPLAGGVPPTTICETDLLFGASWGPNDTIVGATWRGGLWQVPAGGGTPNPLTTLDAGKGEFSHRLPHFLPGGDALIFTVTDLFLPNWNDARLSVVTLATGERRDVGPGADARYLTSGHLVFMRSGALVAAPFDLSIREITGNPLTLLDDVMQAANMPNDGTDSGAGQFALSDAGDLLYLAGGVFPDREKTIVTVDRQGRVETLPVAPRPFFAPLLSPDGTRLVLWTQGLDRNVWIYDIARGTLTRLTTEGRNHRGIWTPDGKRITYAGSVSGSYNLFLMPADGSTPPERLTSAAMTQSPSSWSPDGRTLAYIDEGSSGTVAGKDVMTMLLNGDRRPRPFTPSKFQETYPEFSPDGRWIAYVSDESGRDEVYVQPYPGPGPRTQVSNTGGTAPAWARSGRELFYTTASTGQVRMMSVPITLTPFSAGTPRQLFEGNFALQATTRGYDVTADGQTFYMTQAKERPPVRATHMILVQNWVEELRERVPAK